MSKIEQQKNILVYLDGNGKSNIKQIADALNYSEESVNKILIELNYPTRYVNLTDEGKDGITALYGEIRHEGIEYLQRLELHSFQKRQVELNEETKSIMGRQTDLQKSLDEKQGESINISRKQIWIGGLNILVMIFLIWSTLYIGNKANNIQEIQTDILQRANPSFEPHIEIVPDFEELIMFSGHIADRKYLTLEDEDKGWGRADIMIYNFGKMDAQSLYCHDYDLDEFYAFFTSGHDTNSIQNLNAGTYNRSVLHIKYDDCQLNNIDLCDTENIPKGNVNITLTCNCIGCKTQRKLDVIFPICIYDSGKKDEHCNYTAEDMEKLFYEIND